MAAAAVGNVALVEALLERGADPEACDQYGQNALHWALAEAFKRPGFTQHRLPAIYARIAPASIDVLAGERLVRIDRQLSEYFLLQTLWVPFRSRFTHATHHLNGGFETAAILDAWRHLPTSVLPAQRNRRSHLSNVLSRNEVSRDYAYNRALFQRIGHGWYQFNPALAVRSHQGDDIVWTPVYQRLNLALIHETTFESQWPALLELLAAADLPMPPPLMRAREYAAFVAERQKLELRRARRQTARMPAEPRPVAATVPPLDPPPDPPWGMPAAKALAEQRLAERIAACGRDEGSG